MVRSEFPLEAIAVCGPSGVGKGALLGRLLKEFPDYFGYSVSHTTRAPREGEENGREYHFSDRATVDSMRDNGEFIEVCEVHGNLYGTSVNAINVVRDAGKVCILEVDIKGVQKIRNMKESLNVLYIFVTPPSMEELCERIRKRGADNEEVLQRRLRTAEEELRFVEENSTFFSHIILNKDLDVAYEKLLRIIDETFETCNMCKLRQDSVQ
ncbi:guanylate kinase [Trypanosoma rangeli]|uniref:guanylate kinase n=1 Tax=Trypanosoma rangeli TaxID=5698 RepID=A0A3R7KR08_TRYRA|nr:guanylate kinase [Trypanosoma rangeli]RNF11911.1 guanylate kinase [Trypanosoma rangeli]|eukprot:RNF11911.1 guanylate kinase [Trypanosoma rangeli]